MKASGPPHVIKLWLGVRQGMLCVEYLRPIKASEPPHVIKLWLGVRQGMPCVEYLRPIKASYGVSQTSQIP